MKMHKKLMLGLVTMGLVATSALPTTQFGTVNVQAENITAQGKCGDSAMYKYDKDTNTLTISGSGDMWDDYNFSKGLGEVNAVVIEKGIQTIGSGSFEELEDVGTVTISDTVKTIKSNAFGNIYGTVVMPKSVTKLESEAFGGVKKVVFDGDIVGCDTGAFGSFYEGEVELHGDAKGLGKAYYNYDDVTVTITNDNSKCKVNNGCLLSSDGKVMYYLLSKKSSIKIPDTVETIATAACTKKDCEQITLGANVKTIEPFAFEASDINTLETNDNLKKVGTCAFNGTKIKFVNFKNKVSLGVQAFPASATINNANKIKKAQTTMTLANVLKKNYDIKFAKVNGAKGYQVQVKKGSKKYQYFTKKNYYKKSADKTLKGGKYVGVKKTYSIKDDAYLKTVSGAAYVSVRPYQLTKKGKKVFGKWSAKMVLNSYK